LRVVLKQLGHSMRDDGESFGTENEAWTGPSVTPLHFQCGRFDVIETQPTSQYSRRPEKPILFHDGEHALEFIGRCLRTSRALIPCKFDKTMLNTVDVEDIKKTFLYART
jgi:hypothetical protein